MTAGDGAIAARKTRRGWETIRPPWEGGPLFLTTADVARILSADPRTVRRGIERGVIPAIQVAEATWRIRAWEFWVDVVGLAPESESEPPASDSPSNIHALKNAGESHDATTDPAA